LEFIVSGSVKTEAQNVTIQSMVQQGKSVLNAGGTVYLGETHDQSHAREICSQLLDDRCVQYFCVEYDFQHMEPGDTSQDLVRRIEMLDNITRFRTQSVAVQVTMVDVAKKAANDSGCRIYFIDNTESYLRKKAIQTKSDVRQNFMRDNVSYCRSKIDKIGRGVLVLVGSDHLLTLTEEGSAWQALHEIVYSGRSFVFGKYETCYMVWQLS
jgi:hypothetical protein